MSHLLSISFGPVQPFIAAARKTRDLKAGSQLLLLAVRAAAKALLESSPNALLIFPAADLTDIDEADAANLILAEVPEKPEEAFQAARAAFLGAIQKEWSRTMARLQEKKLDGKVDQQMAEWQLTFVPEIYGAWAPCTEGYEAAREEVGRRLASRKALRDFGQPLQDRPGMPKSPLNPDLEGVLALDGMTVHGDLVKKLLLKPRETLDAFSLIKRMWPEEDDHRDLARFPSVRAVTLAQWLEEHKDLPSVGELKAAIPGSAQFDVADALLDLIDPEEAKPELREALAQLARSARREAGMGSSRFRGYYAILFADGDSMGQALDQLKSRDQHREFSRRLAEFARGAKSTVESHCGALVYSGGDDVLALLPARTALACARDLASSFSISMEMEGLAGSKPTLSVAIRVQHFNENLKASIEASESALKDAKRVFEASGKNVLRTLIDVRAGSAIQFDQQFKEMEGRLSLIEQLIAEHEGGRVPRGWASELEDWSEVLSLAGMSPEHVAAEYERIGARKSPQVAFPLPPSFRSSEGLASFARACTAAQFMTREGGNDE